MDLNIKALSKLARIEISSSEEEILSKRIKKTMDLFNKFPSFEENEFILDYTMPLREDIASLSLKQEDALKNAPKTEYGYVAIPKVIDTK